MAWPQSYHGCGGLKPQPGWTDSGTARPPLEMGKADLSALESSLCSTYPTEATRKQCSYFLWLNPAAFCLPLIQFALISFWPSGVLCPFPDSHIAPLKPLTPFPDFRWPGLTLQSIGFPSPGSLLSPSTSGWHTGSWPLCVFTNHSFLSASLPQAACYCSCGVFLTAFPHKFNTTTPLVQNKRGELAGACKRQGWGLLSSGLFFATAGVHANL